MNLNKKKMLAVRTFGVGKEKITFLESRLADIKEAITKQDMRDLFSQGAIIVSGKKGRKKVRVKARRSVGNVRQKLKNRKKRYVILTRKLRRHVKDMKSSGKLTGKSIEEARKRIRNKEFRSKAHFTENLEEMKNA